MRASELERWQSRQGEIVNAHARVGGELRELVIPGADDAESAIPDSGLLRDYDATELSGSDGDSVTTLPDQQNNDDATGAGSLQTDGINGNQSVLLDGTDDDFTANPVPVASDGSYTFAFAIEIASISDLETILTNGEQGSDGYLIQSGSSTEWDHQHGGIVGNSGSSVSATDLVGVGSYDASNDQFDFEINKQSEISATISDINDPTTHLVIGNNGDGRFANIHVGRYLFYNEYNDSPGRDEIADVLMGQFNIE